MVIALVPGSWGPGSSPGRGHCMVFLGKTLFTFIKNTFYTGIYRCIASLDTSAKYKRSLAIVKSALLHMYFYIMQIIISQFPFENLWAYLNSIMWMMASTDRRNFPRNSNRFPMSKSRLSCKFLSWPTIWPLRSSSSSSVVYLKTTYFGAPISGFNLILISKTFTLVIITITNCDWGINCWILL